MKKKKEKLKESAFKNFFLLKNPLENAVIIFGLLLLIPLLSSWWTAYYEKVTDFIFFIPPHYVLIPWVSIWALSKYIQAPANFLLSLGIAATGATLTSLFVFTSDSIVLGLTIGSLLTTILIKYSLKTNWQKSALIWMGAVITSAVLLWLLSFL